MKPKLYILVLLAVLALSLLACSSEATEEPIKPAEPTVTADPSTYAAATTVEFYTCNHFAQEKHITDNIKITVGKGVTIILCSNRTTGFQWNEEALISDPEVLEQVSHEYKEPISDQAGAAGTEKFTFRGLKAGTSTVSLEYSRPWEGGEQAEWTCVLTVTVK